MEESLSELQRRKPVQTFDLIIIDDVCYSVLDPVAIEPEYTFNINNPSGSLVVELDAESGECSYLISSIVTTPTTNAITIKQAVFRNHILYHKNKWKK